MSVTPAVTAGVTTPGLIPATGIALLVTSVESTPDGLVAVLADNGCAADLLAITEAGALNIFLVGAPPIVNEAFPLSLAPRTAFFVRCVNREAGSGTPGLVDLPLGPMSWRIEYLADEFRPLPSVEFVDGVMQITIEETATGNSPRVAVWSTEAPVVTAGDRYVMEAEARLVTNDGTFVGNYLVGLNAVGGGGHQSSSSTGTSIPRDRAISTVIGARSPVAPASRSTTGSTPFGSNMTARTGCCTTLTASSCVHRSPSTNGVSGPATSRRFACISSTTRTAPAPRSRFDASP